ncbi:MAG: chemotaxis protein CheX [Bdellovibrio sp.]|jgi:CheY-specific phosphatase CheX
MSGKIKAIPAHIDKSIVNAFHVQLSTKAQVRNLSMKPETAELYSIDCLSTLPMKSSGYAGSLSIGFPEKTYFKLIEQMLGEKIDKITVENADAASEILNIVYASARKDINEDGFDFEPSFPTAIIGQNLAMSKSALSGHGLFFQCSSDLGDFLVLLALRTREKEKS